MGFDCSRLLVSPPFVVFDCLVVLLLLCLFGCYCYCFVVCYCCALRLCCATRRRCLAVGLLVSSVARVGLSYGLSRVCWSCVGLVCVLCLCVLCSSVLLCLVRVCWLCVLLCVTCWCVCLWLLMARVVLRLALFGASRVPVHCPSVCVLRCRVWGAPGGGVC